MLRGFPEEGLKLIHSTQKHIHSSMLLLNAFSFKHQCTRKEIFREATTKSNTVPDLPTRWLRAGQH